MKLQIKNEHNNMNINMRMMRLMKLFPCLIWSGMGGIKILSNGDERKSSEMNEMEEEKVKFDTIRWSVKRWDLWRYETKHNHVCAMRIKGWNLLKQRQSKKEFSSNRKAFNLFQQQKHISPTNLHSEPRQQQPIMTLADIKRSPSYQWSRVALVEISTQ
jgi:hypothetical protein